MADDYQPIVLNPVEDKHEPVEEIKVKEEKPKVDPSLKQMQAIQNTIAALKAQTNLSASEQLALDTLTNLSYCNRELEDTEAIQEQSTFIILADSINLKNGQWIMIIPEPDSGDSFKKRGASLFVKMHLAGQECLTQIKLMGYHTRPLQGFCNERAYFQPYHTDQSTIEFVKPEWTDRKDRRAKGT